jgi:predicted CoA-substrate-specific enzyme activase
MITAGIDVGAKRVKAVIVKQGEVLARSAASTGLEEKEGIAKVFREVLEVAGISREDIVRVVATGMGSRLIDFADETMGINIANARGAAFFCPSVRTVIDVGAEESRVITCENGRVTAFAVNDRCAAGVGTFIDAMAHILEVTPEELGQLALKTECSSQISSQCTVFAESEVVAMVSSESSSEEIGRAVVNAVAERTNSLARRLIIEPDLVLIGGLARNPAFSQALASALEAETLIVPEDPEFVGALGAALVAAERAAEAA